MGTGVRHDASGVQFTIALSARVYPSASRGFGTIPMVSRVLAVFRRIRPNQSLSRAVGLNVRHG